MVLLDIAEQYELSDDMLEGLENGVPLTFVTRITMRRQRNLMWDEDLIALDMKKLLRYHPLSSQYQVDNQYTHTQQLFATRDAALRALGETRDLPLIQESRLESGHFYLVDVQSWHEIGALPLPLRPMAYVTPGWHLSSKVWEWQLKQ